MIKSRLPILNTQLAHFERVFSAAADRPPVGRKNPACKQPVAPEPGSNHVTDYVIRTVWSFYLVVLQDPLAKSVHTLPCGAKGALTGQGWQLIFKLSV